ncbi:hypothetical protein HPB48_001400 [Haemaphysalis longicornis]|uniref:Uncharacterized protein n=1 Tax=Haemaphysalis longicornis TaxID=44386 RepID=A0A9J6GAM8_HAELO|nr:hypothetical protein HPB48_001400 [Haemaphysalis longicornis]
MSMTCFLQEKKSSRAYFPAHADMNNHVQAALKKDRFSTIDQENMAVLTERLRTEEPETQTFYRLYAAGGCEEARVINDNAPEPSVILLRPVTASRLESTDTSLVQVGPTFTAIQSEFPAAPWSTDGDSGRTPGVCAGTRQRGGEALFTNMAARQLSGTTIPRPWLGQWFWRTQQKSLHRVNLSAIKTCSSSWNAAPGDNPRRHPPPRRGGRLPQTSEMTPSAQRRHTAVLLASKHRSENPNHSQDSTRTTIKQS